MTARGRAPLSTPGARHPEHHRQEKQRPHRRRVWPPSPQFLGAQSTSSGKTTLLQALAGELDPRERVIAIEDKRELDLIGLPNCSRWKARRGRDADGLPSVKVRRLVRHALRARPDRIFVGEVRGSEALARLQALNTGHGGSLSTIHASNAKAAPGRLAACAMQTRDGLPWDAVCMMVGAAVDVIVHFEREWQSGRRRVAECVELQGFDPQAAEWIWGESRRPPDAGGGGPR